MPFEFAITAGKKIDFYIGKYETKYGRNTTALIIGLLVLAISAIYVTPRLHISDHIMHYCKLSLSPFDFSEDNPMRYRILSPILAYITGLRGTAFIFFPRIFCLFFSIAVFLYYRKKYTSPAETVIMLSLLCFSNVYLFSLNKAGYTDIVSYFFIFLAYIYLQRPLLLGLFLMLAIFNHESSLFLVVPLFVQAIAENKEKSAKSILLNFLAFTLPIALYVFFRKVISEYTVVHYDTDFYFSKSNISYSLKTIFTNIPLGYFYVFKLFWFFPVYFLFYSALKKQYKHILIIGLYLLFTLMQLIIAWDVTRLLCLCFPVMLYTAEKVRELWGTDKFVKFSLALIAFNFFVPQYYVWVDGPQPMMPFFFHLPYQLIKIL